MKALVYRRSVPLYLLGRILGRIQPRRFFPRLAPFGLREIPVPRNQRDWVLLKNSLCGICGSDLGLLRGMESFLLEPYASFPAVLGHEIAAAVVAAPKDSQWNTGERVVVEPLLSCAERGMAPCRFCSQGSYNLCESFTAGNLAAGPVIGYNRSLGGGMAEFMLAPPGRLIRIPDSLTDEKAVLADSLASALQPILDHFPRDDQTVVVFGAGILGQHAIRILRALGSRARLAAVARYPFQQELARNGGADLVLKSPNRGELGKAVGAKFIPTTLGGGNLEGGADLVFDFVASRRSFQEALIALRARGKYIMVGTAASIGPVDFSSLWFRELRVTGSVSYAFGNYEGQRVRTYQMAIDLLAKGYPTEGLLTHTCSLSEFARAFKTAFNKSGTKSVKVAIDLRKIANNSASMAACKPDEGAS
jgi:erythritol/L-threitol dehydrogenase